MRTTASWFADAASLRAYRKGWPERREERGVGSLSDPWGALSLCRGFGKPWSQARADFTVAALSVWLPGRLGFRPSKINNPLIQGNLCKKRPPK